MEFFKKVWACIVLGSHFFKLTLQLVWGAWKIGKLPQPIISIFGGARLASESNYVALARQMARMLVKNNISVITGGGPGIMEAASAGAVEEKSGETRTMGIGVVGLKGEEGFNPYVKNSVMLDYFFARKYLLIYYSVAFIFFPGGYGTLDELFELLTLIQTGKVPEAPIILIGTEYWKFFFEWLKSAEAQKEISLVDYQFIILTDDLDHALSLVIEHCKKHNKL